MPTWKLNIFVNAIKICMKRDAKTAEDIIQKYTKLAEDEKKVILNVINLV